MRHGLHRGDMGAAVLRPYMTEVGGSIVHSIEGTLKLARA
jgi:hypothetical protein